MGRVVVLGSSNLDLTVCVKDFPSAGETVVGSELRTCPGGKGANQAVAAARAGADVVFLAGFGDDAHGEILRKHLIVDQIHLSHCWRFEGVPSGVAMILLNGRGENQIAVAPGANHRITPEHIQQLPSEVLTPPGVFVSQLETPLNVVLTGLKIAKSRGMKTIVNPAPARADVAVVEWTAAIDVLILNQTEAAILGRVREVPNQKAAAAIARRLLEGGCGAVIVTFGAEGYSLFERENAVHERGWRVPVVDTVGAGDAFVGAIACRLSEGLSVEESATWANRAAALAVTRPGAQTAIPTRREIDDFNPQSL